MAGSFQVKVIENPDMCTRMYLYIHIDIDIIRA